jgi:hypothetical protein
VSDGKDERVKDLLGRAFGEEPPLRIDRDQVIGQGRKRLRRKRFLEAGGVVAAVVVVAVGAVTLTGLTGSEPDRLPPAASTDQQAPPGPRLPVTTGPYTPVPPDGEVPARIREMNPDQLTATLYSLEFVSQKEAQALPERPGVPKFELLGDRYVFEADVAGPKGHGFLQVMVGLSDTIGGQCAVRSPVTDCKTMPMGKTDVVISHFRAKDGQRQTTAFVVMPDGMRIYAMATNTATQVNGQVRPPSDGAPPVLDDIELSVLVTKVGTGA